MWIKNDFIQILKTISFKEEPVYPHQRLTNKLNSSLYDTAKSNTYFEKIKLITLRLDKYSQLSRFSIYQLQRRQVGLQCLVSQHCKKVSIAFITWFSQQILWFSQYLTQWHRCRTDTQWLSIKLISGSVMPRSRSI